MAQLAYKKNSEFVFQRLRSLYDDRVKDKIFASFSIPSPTLVQFNKTHTAGPCDYPDPAERAAYWDSFLKERTLIDDDSLPVCYMSEFDQGLYGGVIGGKVEYCCFESGWISSMCRPILKNWSDVNSLRFDESHPLFQQYIKQTKIFAEKAKDKFGISHLILVDGFNFVFELFGATETYMGMYDHPEEIQRAMEFGFDLNVLLHKTFFQYAPIFEDGTFCTLSEWIPGGEIISESLDPFHMTSVETYMKWGHDYAQRMFDQFDGGFLHIHGNGRHLIKPSSSLKGLKTIFLGDDRGFPPALEVVYDLKNKAGDVPISILADYNAFVEKLDRHELPGGILYRVLDTPSRDAANKCYEKVLKYRV